MFYEPRKISVQVSLRMYRFGLSLWRETWLLRRVRRRRCMFWWRWIKFLSIIKPSCGLLVWCCIYFQTRSWRNVVVIIVSLRRQALSASAKKDFSPSTILFVKVSWFNYLSLRLTNWEVHFVIWSFADINECALINVCDHECTNFPGSYKCSCHESYALQPDGRTCSKISESKFSSWKFFRIRH